MISQVFLQIPSTVTFSHFSEETDSFFLLQGPFGIHKISLTTLDPSGDLSFSLSSLDGKRILSFKSRKKAFLFTVKACFQNWMKGITQGFSRTLILSGIGSRWSLQTEKRPTLSLFLGQSHPLRFIWPSEVEIAVLSKTRLCIFGIDLQKVTQVGAQLKKIAPPDPYKGKGIRYEFEPLVLKKGKKK